jgi:hypothetical protein
MPGDRDYNLSWETPVGVRMRAPTQAEIDRARAARPALMYDHTPPPIVPPRPEARAESPTYRPLPHVDRVRAQREVLAAAGTAPKIRMAVSHAAEAQKMSDFEKYLAESAIRDLAERNPAAGPEVLSPYGQQVILNHRAELAAKE